MGMLWEIHQQNQRRQQAEAHATTEERVAELEAHVAAQDQVIGKLIQQLEVTLGEDLDGDGLVARAAQ